MKKVITIIGIFGLIFVQAQVGISTDDPHENSDLELGSSNKALLLNRVNSEADIATAVEGMIIFDATEHCFKGYQNSAWVDITTCTAVGGVTALDCANATFNPSTAQVNTAYTGTLSIPYTGGNGGAYSAQSISSTGLTATIAAGTLANGAGTLEYNVSGTATSAGTASFAINIGGQPCTATINIAEALPPTITLQGGKHFVVSTYDTDYLPHTTPTVPATLDTNVAANGTTDPIIDVQGKITTTAISITIPATATGNGTLPAYSTTINIPANMTQDGIARDITLSWASQAYTTATKTINATIKAEVGDLLVKKLDIQTGIGSDHLGVLMGTFSIPSNSAGAMENFEVRNIAGIPDRRFHETTDLGGVTKRYHDFVYLPVEVTGTHNVNGQPYKKIWLNMNLGAEYAKAASSDFNILVKNSGLAAHQDGNTFGSFFQWQRKADGHEFKNSAVTNALANSWTASGSWDGKFITTSSPYNWVNGGENSSGVNVQLWQSDGSNNPCPVGYHIPTHAEWQDLHEALTGSRSYLSSSSVFWNQTKLPNFSSWGSRRWSDGEFHSYHMVSYWSSTANLNHAYNAPYTFSFSQDGSSPSRERRQATGHNARCLKD